jgi:hypothetical protein
MAMADQLTDFNSRVVRISKSGNTSYYDPELGMNIPKRVSKEFINRKKTKQAGGSSIVVSLLLGAVCLMLSYLICLRLDLINHDAPMLVYGIAGILAIVLGGMFRLKSMTDMGAQFVGVGAMMVGMHNLIWAFPEPFAVIYSPEFVDIIQATTTANSIAFMSMTYMF